MGWYLEKKKLLDNSVFIKKNPMEILERLKKLLFFNVFPLKV